MKNRFLAIIGIKLILGLASNTALAVCDDYFKCTAYYKNQMDNKNYENALNYISKAIELIPKSEYAYYERSNLFKKLNRFSEALDDANKLIELYPKSVWADEMRSLISSIKEKINPLPQVSLSWSKGDLTTAQNEFNKAVEYNPKLLKFPLYHLKKPTFLNIGDTRRLVPDQETLLVNEAAGKILYPYHDVTVDPTNLTEGRRVEVSGECPQTGTLCSLNLKVTADLDLEHALLWGDKLPPQSTQIQLEPALSKVYTFTAEIPVDMAAQPFDLILTSRKGQSFKRVLQLQGTQLQITAPKDLSNEL